MLKYKIIGLKKLQAAVNAAPAAIASQDAIALNSSVNLIKRMVIAVTPRGPGHFGYHAIDRWRTSVQVQLRRSIGRITTDAPQMRWRETGTKAHDIRPSRAQALTITGGVAGHGMLGHDVLGMIVSTVHHPGEKPRHALRKAYRAALPTIRGYFVGALQQAARTMATSGD